MEEAAGVDVWAVERGDSLHPGGMQGVPLFLKVTILSPLPLERGDRMPLDVPRGKRSFPRARQRAWPFLQKKRETALCCEGGRLRGRMFGR